MSHTLEELEAMGLTDPNMAALAQTKRMEATADVRRAEKALQEAEERAAKTQYTVADLIQDLIKQDPDALVYMEGCDCTGQCKSVSKDGSDVMLNRSTW